MHCLHKSGKVKRGRERKEYESAIPPHVKHSTGHTKATAPIFDMDAKLIASFLFTLFTSFPHSSSQLPTLDARKQAGRKKASRTHRKASRTRARKQAGRKQSRTKSQVRLVGVR